MTDYPSSIVWMIECRHWHDDDDIKPGEPIDQGKAWMRYAPVEPSEFGSGVVIQLEQLGNDDKPLNPPVIKNFILTCRHVVRAGDSEVGPVYYKEIICWKPGKGYNRTIQYNINRNEGRQKGQMEGGYLASVSALSPHEDPSRDWALLEVLDSDQRDPFNSETCIMAGDKGKVGTEVRIIGYPYGAGWEKERDKWKEGVRFWPTGEPVENFSSSPERIDKVEGEKLRYRGDVETRPGMSGGGVFQASDNALVGLHNSRHDGSLTAFALNYSDIIKWLKDHRHVRPVYPEPEKPPATDRKLWAIVAGVLVVAGCLLAMFYLDAASPGQLPELSYARFFGAVEVPFLINGGVVPSSQHGPPGTLGHFDFTQTLGWWKGDPSLSRSKFLRDPVFSKVQTAYQSMEGFYPFDNSLWKLMAGKNDLLLRAMYASLDPSLPIEKVPEDYKRAMQIFRDKGWADPDYRGNQVDFAQRTLDSALKEIGYLFLCIKVPQDQAWDSMKVAYKYWPAQSLREERNPEIKKGGGYKTLELQLPVDIKDAMLIWLIEVYRKDSDGYEATLLGDVALPETLLLQRGKKTYRLPIRLPLGDKASKVSLPIGWYMQ